MRYRLALVVTFIVMFGASYQALADGSAAIDAGVVADAGSAAAPVIPDPLTAPGDSVSILTKLWKGGAWAPFAILLAFFALSIAAKKIEWLRTGKRAAYSAAALGGLTVLVGAASQGQTPNIAMIASALMATIALALNPAKPSEPAK